MRLILLIYTTPARLLNALALRGYFREATSKKGSAETEKTSTNRMAVGFSPGDFPVPIGRLDRVTTDKMIPFCRSLESFACSRLLAIFANRGNMKGPSKEYPMPTRNFNLTDELDL